MKVTEVTEVTLEFRQVFHHFERAPFGSWSHEAHAHLASRQRLESKLEEFAEATWAPKLGLPRIVGFLSVVAFADYMGLHVRM